MSLLFLQTGVAIFSIFDAILSGFLSYKVSSCLVYATDAFIETNLVSSDED